MKAVLIIKIPDGKYCRNIYDNRNGNGYIECQYWQEGKFRDVCQLGLGILKDGKQGTLKPNKCLELKSVEDISNEIHIS